MADGRSGDEGTHCEWCGAEYEPGADPATARPVAPPRRLPAARPDAAEPVTHCEWCGAEYPVPGDAGSSPAGDR
jgi:hypothetical protein